MGKLLKIEIIKTSKKSKDSLSNNLSMICLFQLILIYDTYLVFLNNWNTNGIQKSREWKEIIHKKSLFYLFQSFWKVEYLNIHK